MHEQHTSRSRRRQERRGRLRLLEAGGAAGEPPAMPRTIGHVIAQAALIADSAVKRSERDERPLREHGPGGWRGRFGWFL